jgi:tetratricopeptide (TPR) repeat protein
VSCLPTPEEKSARWLRSAKASMVKKEYNRAVIELLNAVQSTPKNAEAHYQLGLALLNSGAPDDRALKSFKTAIDLDPKRADAQLRLSELLSAADDEQTLALAERYARAALQQQSNDPEILFTLAIIEGRRSKTQAAIEHLERSLAIAPGHLKSSTALAAIQWSVERDGASAEQTLRRAIEHSPNSSEASIALGRLYAASARPQAAEIQFRRTTAAHPHSGEALLELARTQQSLGKTIDAEQTFRRLSALPDKTYRTFHAMFLFERGRQNAAIAELQRLWTSDPGDRNVRSRLVDCYLKTARLGEAEKALNSVLRRDSRDVDALEQQGELFIRQSRFQDAEKSASEALRVQPLSASACYTLAQAYRGQGRIVQYRQELRRALERNPALLQARIELTESLRHANALNDALAVVKSAPMSQQQEPLLLTERAWVLIALGRYAEARTDADRALSISRAPAALIQAGLLDIYNNRHEAGRAALEEALIGVPDNVEALNAIARSFASQRNLRAAVDRVQKQAAKLPKSADAQFVLGSWLEQTGDVAAAARAYASALRLDPAHAPPAIAYARLEMLLQGDWDAARHRVQSVLARDPRNVDALLALGMSEDGGGRRDAAIKAYRTLLQIDPSHTVAKNNLAVRLTEDFATLDEAFTLAQEAKRAFPDNPAVDDTIGWVYYKKGLHHLAIRHLERAAEKTRDARTRYHLAIAYFSAGDRRQGQNTLAVARELNPDLPEAKLAQQIADASTNNRKDRDGSR